ncbi:PKD domain-containing protein [Parasediminibacterium sp. JCM 36343]|uniref:PKD domain-containing protein n=1 Tax=Parasediminibacterium sp. JCM 36343 TaxID=3374279 RepID=UPI0039784D1D
MGSTPTTNKGDTTTIVGSTTTKGDTTIVTVGTVSVSYTKTSPCYPSTEIFTFKGLATGVPADASYNWYFGDGHTGLGTSVQHGYDNAAPFVVLLEITNDTGKVVESASFGVKAWGQQLKPVAIFSSKQDFNDNPNYLTFNSASSVNHGSIINNFWDWGDGTTQSTATALTRHGFPILTQDKNYPVKLTITTDAGCTADTVVNVWVPATYPITGDFSAVAKDACTNESIVFTPQATNVPTGSIYNWHFSDGTGDLTGNPITYSFAYMNHYDVIMYITLNGRTIYTTHKAVDAKGPNAKPKASFYYTWEKTQNPNIVPISFNSQSTIQHGGIDGYIWDFGNNVTNNDYNSFVENTYQKTRSYTTYQIRLIVTGNGCADTAYQSVGIPAK